MSALLICGVIAGLMSAIQAQTQYIIYDYIVGEDTTHAPYPLDTCVIYEIQGVIFSYGMFSCDDGNQGVTLTGYGQDPTCSTSTGTVATIPSGATAGQRGSFSCDGAVNVWTTTVYTTLAGSVDVTTCCGTEGIVAAVASPRVIGVCTSITPSPSPTNNYQMFACDGTQGLATTYSTEDCSGEGTINNAAAPNLCSDAGLASEGSLQLYQQQTNCLINGVDQVAQTSCDTSPPSMSPSTTPSMSPSATPSRAPTETGYTYPPTSSPTMSPSTSPTAATDAPSMSPTAVTNGPSATPSMSPSSTPSMTPSGSPSSSPSRAPTIPGYTYPPSATPSMAPSTATDSPSATPTMQPTNDMTAYYEVSFVTPDVNYLKAIPLDMCVIIELTNLLPNYGMATCNEAGDELTYTTYGQDSSCSTTAVTTTAVTEATKFNCNGQKNYRVEQTTAVTNGTGTYDTCCKAELAGARVQIAEATGVCVASALPDGTTGWAMTSCDAAGSVTAFYSDATCSTKVTDVSQSTIDSCDMSAKNAVSGLGGKVDTYNQLVQCMDNGVLLTGTASCTSMAPTMGPTMSPVAGTNATETNPEGAGANQINLNMALIFTVFCVAYTLLA